MAEGSNNLTTYYAKRIIGDSAAATASKALLQSGTGITDDTWIFHRTNRTSVYGIRYDYDSSSNGTKDRLELYGGYQVSSTDTPTVWARLDTGDVHILGKVGIGYDPNTSGNSYKLYVKGTSYFYGTTYLNDKVGIGYNPATSGNGYKLRLEGGQVFFNYTTASSTSNTSSQLIVSNSNGGNVALELWRGSNASWQIANESGVLYIRNNYTSTKQNTYSQNGLILDYNTGAASLPYLAIGQTSRDTTYKLYVNGTSYFNDNTYLNSKVGIGYDPNTSGNAYKLYVNGTSYFNGNTTHNGIDYFANGTTYYIDNSANGYLNALQLKTNLTFDATGTTGTSGKITWSGSTDGADIYYYVPSSDQGNLIINTRDDTNCLVAFAYNGTIKAYINNSTPSFYPATTNTGNIGTSTSEWGTTYTRIIYARHFDASYPYTSDRNMYYGYNKADNHYFYTMDGTTRTHRATINATGLFINQPATNRNAGIIGSYDYTKAALIWSMGSSYNIAANGSGLGSLYGAAYGYQGQSYLGSNNYAGGHQFLWCQNGTVNVALGSNIWTNGSLYITGADHGIYYTGTKNTYRMIRFIDNTADAYGNGISIGGGGQTIIGGGESADTAAAQVGTGGSEIMYVCNDGDVNIFSNMQNGWASRKTFTFNTSGNVVLPSGSRVGESGGALYLGNSGNQSWVYVQDMASQSGTDKWKITQAGAATFVGSVTAGSFAGAHTNINGTKRDLQIRYGGVTLNYCAHTTVTFSPAFSNACLMVIPINQQEGYGAGQALSVDNLSKTSCRMYNWNTAAAACWCGYVAIGY